jgi:hypothetical protein
MENAVFFIASPNDKGVTRRHLAAVRQLDADDGGIALRQRWLPVGFRSGAGPGELIAAAAAAGRVRDRRASRARCEPG